MHNIINKKNEHAADKRREIAELVKKESDHIRTDTIKTITIDDLKLMFRLYDRIFFNSWFAGFYTGEMRFSFSKRMTKSAGITIAPKSISKIPAEKVVLEIRISLDFMRQYYQLDGQKTVCGINTGSNLEALQLIFEHELCHAIEFILYGKSSCSNNRFKAIAGNVFGHTASSHMLPTNRQIAREKYNIAVGDTVSFSYEGKNLTGVIYNISKRATVMVSDKAGNFVDKNGSRYLKYYVPVSMLKIAGK